MDDKSDVAGSIIRQQTSRDGHIKLVVDNKLNFDHHGTQISTNFHRFRTQQTKVV